MINVICTRTKKICPPQIRCLLLTTSTFLMNVVLLFFFIAWYLLHVPCGASLDHHLSSSYPTASSDLITTKVFEFDFVIQNPSTHTPTYIHFHTRTHIHRSYTIPAPRMKCSRVKHGTHVCSAILNLHARCLTLTTSTFLMNLVLLFFLIQANCSFTFLHPPKHILHPCVATASHAETQGKIGFPLNHTPLSELANHGQSLSNQYFRDLYLNPTFRWLGGKTRKTPFRMDSRAGSLSSCWNDYVADK